jgi:predicted dehydrogenase
VKAILVGAGGMGRTWAKNLTEHPEVELVSWVDVVPGQVERSAAEVGIQVTAFTDLGDALRQSGADFVVDVTIPEAHEAVTIQSLEYGLPVLGEKPMAASLEAAQRMITASERAEKLYMVSQSRRYDGRLSAFKELVHGVGNIGIINADFYIGAHFGGFRDAMKNVLILDMAIHTFDQMRELTGLNVVDVYAEEFNPSWSWYKHGSSANCIFTLNNGARFNYRGSWCADGLHTSWEAEWRVVGENGTAKWDGLDRIEAAYVKSREGSDFHLPARHVTAEPHEIKSGIAGSLEDFLNALRTGETPKGECHDNYESLRMVFGAIEKASSTGLKREAQTEFSKVFTASYKPPRTKQEVTKTPRTSSQ